MEFPDRSLNNLSIEGISSIHDSHQVAQKLIHTTEPFMSERVRVLLLISTSLNSDGALPIAVILRLCLGLIVKKAIATPESKSIRKIRGLDFTANSYSVGTSRKSAQSILLRLLLRSRMFSGSSRKDISL